MSHQMLCVCASPARHAVLTHTFKPDLAATSCTQVKLIPMHHVDGTNLSLLIIYDTLRKLRGSILSRSMQKVTPLLVDSQNYSVGVCLESMRTLQSLRKKWQ